MEELSKRTRTRYLLTLLVLITIPCYLLGFILLRLDRGPLSRKDAEQELLAWWATQKN